MPVTLRVAAAIGCALVVAIAPAATRTRLADVTVEIDTRMAPPRWAQLERRLLAANAPACREFFGK